MSQSLPRIQVTLECTLFQASLHAALYDILHFESAEIADGIELSAPTLDTYEALLDLVTGILDEALRETPPYRGEAFAGALRAYVAERILPRLEYHLTQAALPHKTQRPAKASHAQ